MSTIADNLARIRERIESAASRAGRNADQITLIAVSKNHSAEAIREAWEAGVHHFGENRVQEWEGKRTELAGIAGAYTSHLIGHLQSNKAARALKAFDRIDSVDEFSLAQKLNRLRTETPAAPKLPVLLEVHLGNEETKTGVTEEPCPNWPSGSWNFLSSASKGLCASRHLLRIRKKRDHFLRNCGVKGKTRNTSRNRASATFNGHVS